MSCDCDREKVLFLFGVTHGLSYLLDPRLLGTHLHAEGPASRVQVENTLFNTPDDDVTTVTEEQTESLCT